LTAKFNRWDKISAKYMKSWLRGCQYSASPERAMSSNSRQECPLIKRYLGSAARGQKSDRG
jgi:hypothetical protein